MKTYFVDTETCGFHGLPIIMQWAVDDGPVKIHGLWGSPIDTCMSLIEEVVANRVVAHNLKFDWFHLSKMYNIYRQVEDKSQCLLETSMDKVAAMEYEARNGLCLKPAKAVDTLILAQRGMAQSAVMESKPVYVRKVLRSMSESILEELELRTDLPWILFARQADPDSPRWKVAERTDETTEENDPVWVDLKLSFRPSNGLKDLCKFLLNYEVPSRFEDIAVDKQYNPAEEGFAPFASILSSPEEGWLYKEEPTWPRVIHHHIDHWSTHAKAIKYAEMDIDMLQQLYKFFGSVEDDVDSMLAAQVASVRIKGFTIDTEAMESSRKDSLKVTTKAKLNTNSPKQVHAYLAEAMDPMEQIVVANGCDKHVLAELVKSFTLDAQEDCYCDAGEDCIRCGSTGVVGPGPMPVVLRAEHVNDVRQHLKRIELFNKLLLAGRAYASFNVIGAKSGRMSGTDGLNFQGVSHAQDVRELFTLSEGDWTLSGGDYDSQELAILATTSGDMDLLNDIKGGKSLHGLMAAELFSTSYEDIMEHKNNDPEKRYDKAKSAVYLLSYGGSVETMSRNLSLPLDTCQKGFDGFLDKYEGMKSSRKAMSEKYSAMTSEGAGINFHALEEDFVETMFGFRRSFFNELAVQKTIFNLAQKLPQKWTTLQMNVQRQEGRVQTVSGAISSALYGAAYSMQNRIVRIAMNHMIQGTGRALTMGLQEALWEVQPKGITPFKLSLMSIHDEIVVCGGEESQKECCKIVSTKITEQCKSVPLIALEWNGNLDNWFHLKSAKGGLKCGFNN